jgi:type VI secretion system protein ImpJ
MTRGRDVPDAVQWHEGMLLSPQHFQQAAMRDEMLLQYHVQAASPFPWGVRQLRVDPMSLPDGTYRIVELEAVMPDGLLVTHEAGDALELSVSLRDAAAATPNVPLRIHLVVPTRRAGGVSGTAALARYASYEGLPVTDLNTGEGELAMPRLRPQPSLIIADAPPDKYASIPLAEVEYRDEAFVATEYIPPLLTVTPQSDLGKLCAHVTRRVREKSVYLGDRARATDVASRSALLLDTELMAEALSMGLPPVEALLGAGVAHPFPLFIQMCAFAGLSSAAGRAVVPPVFKAYDHTNLRATFAQVAAFVNGILDEIHEEYRAVPFTPAGRAFELALDASWMQGPNLIIGAVGQAGASEADTAAWLEGSLISSDRRMGALRDRRVRGPNRAPLPAPDTLGIAVRRGEVIFTVAVDPQYVEAGQKLQVVHQVDSAPGHPREVVLYVANRS